MPHVCRNCYEIYDSTLLNHHQTFEFCCPKRNCSTDMCLVEIDDLLVDPIVTLWKSDIDTKFCCSGHLYEEHNNSYIIISHHDKRALRKIWNLSKQICKVYTELYIDGNEKAKSLNGDSFIVRGKSNELKQNRLQAMMQLCLFCYDLAEKYPQ